MEKLPNVRKIHLDYLYTISSIQWTGERATSRKVTDTLGRSRSGVETLNTLEALGYITDISDTHSRKIGKNWNVTSLGLKLLYEDQKRA